MKSLEEYRKELEKDPKARRRLKKLEKEFQQVEDSLTEEELVKYGLKPAVGAAASDVSASDVTASGTAAGADSDAGSANSAASLSSVADNSASSANKNAADHAASVLDTIARKI